MKTHVRHHTRRIHSKVVPVCEHDRHTQHAPSQGTIVRAPFENRKMNWINATLLNDETSSDDELRSYFMTEGKMSLAEADYYVRQRDAALKDMYYHAKPYRGTYFEINPAYAGKTGAEISIHNRSFNSFWD